MFRQFIFFLALSILAVKNTRCQEDDIFSRLSVKDGLLTNNILSIWQDSTGYLWLGSQSGLQRYDGNFFRTILSGRTDQIFADSAQRVWIRSGNKIGVFNPVSFAWRNISYETADTGKDVEQLHLGIDASGKVFLIINRQYCQYYSTESGTFSKKNNPFVLPDSLQIADIIEDKRKDRYWILSQNGLGYWDKKNKTFYTTNNNLQNDPLLASKVIPAHITRLFIDRSNHYWIEAWQNADRRFFCYDAIKNQFTHDTAGLANAGNGNYFELRGFTQYDDSVIAVYGLNCLRINTSRSFRELRYPHLNNPYAIHFNIVSAIFEDREGIKWFATDDGLYSSRGNLPRNIHGIINMEKSRGAITSLAEDAQQRLWIGTREQGVLLMTIKPGATPEVTKPGQLKFPDPNTKLVWTIAEDKNTDRLWMGCEQGRLMIYDLKTDQATLHKPAIFNNSPVRQILPGGNGVLWLGLDNGDLISYSPSGNSITDAAFRKILHFDGSIARIKFMNDKFMWIGVNGKGLYLIDIQNRKIIQAFNPGKLYPEPATGVKDMLQLTDSTWLLAGERLGFLNMKTSRIDFTASIDNLPVGSAFALQKDQYGNCWIGSSNGIFKFNPKTRSLTKYSLYDGLITIDNNSYIPETSIHMSDNRLAFAGNQHLLVFDPADYRSMKAPPGVTITGFQLNNRYLPPDSLQALRKINIPYNQTAFSIEFASIDFSLLGKLTYEYKLEGLDNDWNILKTVAPVQYNFLPPGNYSFMVRAKNDEGQYSGITTIALHIVPPFWKTPWFYILIGALVASILYYLHRLRLQRLLHVEKVRSRLARDLHDDMGSTLSTVNILSNMALQQTPLDEKTSKEFMSTINSSTGQMMEAMDDIVWSINPVNDSMAKVLARMKETAGAVLEPVQVEYHFQVNEDVMNLHFSMESRRDIFLIFKEALNNVVKYAHCKNVLFILHKEGPQFTLTIQDDGRGFTSAAGSSSLRGNGLKNMQKRAENMKGNVSIVSEPGRGTSITLSMPIA